MASHAADPPADRIAELLRRELRASRSEAVEDGADPEEVTADLAERVRRLRRLNETNPAGRPPEQTED